MMATRIMRTAATGLVALVALAQIPTGTDALSDACREQFAWIQTHPEYAKSTKKFYKYCRLRIENKLTACCDTVNFV